MTTIEVVDPVIIAVLSGMVIPLLTGIAVKLGAKKGVYAAIAAALSVVAGFVSQLAAGESIDWRLSVVAIMTAFVSNIGMYLGVYKPAGVLNSDPLTPGKVNEATRSLGVGTPVADPVHGMEDERPGDGGLNDHLRSGGDH